MMDVQEIAIVATEVTNRQAALFSAMEADAQCQEQLDDAKAQAVIDGLITGKNAEERDAKAAQVLAELIGAQRVTAAKVKHAKMMLDRSMINWERVKYTIRLMEVIK
jgi:hypothetical protein